HRTRRTSLLRAILQFQRNCGHLAAKCDRERRWMAARYADGRYRSQLPRTNGGMEVSVSAAHRLPRRTSCRNEFFQKPAGAVGERIDSDCHQTASANPQEQSALEDKDRSIFPSHGEHFLSADDRAVVPAAARHDRETQSGLV